MKKRITSVVLALCLVLPLLPVEARAAQVDETCGDHLTWTLNNDGVLAIHGTGPMYNYGTYNPPWKNEAASITSVTIENGVTSIGRSAFSGCSSLTSVTIPDSVTDIGDYAFKGCTGLTSVTIPDSVTDIGDYAFEECTGLTSAGPIGSGSDYQFGWTSAIPDSAFAGCSGLTSVDIPDSVASIGNFAFAGCSGLTSVDIPDSVASIGNFAFAGCSGLTSVDIPDSVTDIGNSAFGECTGLTSVTIPGNVTAIKSGVFSGCSGLTGVDIPEGVTSIGNSAFESSGLTGVTIPKGVTSIERSVFKKCSGLTSITIPEGVTSIGEDAFYGCGLTSVEIPGNVTSIGEYAFFECGYLTSVDILEGVTNIGKHAFRRCYRLTDVTIPESVTSIGSCAFSDCYRLTSVEIPGNVATIENYVFDGCGALTSVTIPESVTSIGASAFKGCRSLTGVTIPEGVTSIGEHAFEGCVGLTSVDIPGKVTAIEKYAFYDCKGLTSVTIPDSVSSIGESAFYGCSGLTGVTIPDGVNSIEGGAFYGCSGLTGNMDIPAGVTSIGNSVFTGTKISSIQVDGGNLHYTSQDGVLFTKDKTTLVAYPGGKTGAYYTMPSSVTSIGNYLFCDCKGLTSVDIPEGVTSIGYSAFSGCSGLTSVGIPSSVTSIGESAFSWSGLKDVYYSGSKEEWERISIDRWNNELENANIHYNSLMPIPFTVTFDLNYAGAAGAPDTQTVPRGSTAARPADPTRTNYTFGGWYKEADCKNAWNFATDTVAENITLYARWTESGTTPGDITVTIQLNGGTLGSGATSLTVNADGKVEKPAKDPTRPGYIFVGWYKDASCTTVWDFSKHTVNSSTTIYAKWEKDNSGSGINTVTPGVVTVTIQFNGGTSGSGSSTTTLTVNADGKVEKPAQDPVRDGYTFIGWYTDASCTTVWDFSEHTVNSSTTIYAGWKEKGSDVNTAAPGVVTVTIELNDGTFGSGSSTATLTVNADGKVEKPAQDPVRDGYTFIGWYTDASCTTVWDFSTHTVNSNTTIYAGWKEKDSGGAVPGDITVTIQLNGGTLGSGITSLIVNADGKVEKPAQDPVRDGYIFIGWYTDASCTTVWDFSKHTVNSNTTIYAGWKAKDNSSGGTTTPSNITVTIQLNGGTLSSGAVSLTVNADGKVEKPAQDPTRPGYIFTGWYTDASCTTIWDFSTHTVNSNTTIYAGWKEADNSGSTITHYITTSSSVSGGSVYMSHSFAVAGTRVTIELRPWSGYTLNWLSVNDLSTGQGLPLTRRYNDEYSFIMPDSPVKVEASFQYTGGSGWYVPEEPSVSNKPAKWYYRDGQIWHITDGLVPYSTPLTRDMLISVFYNMDPSSTGEPLFWATEYKIMPDIYPSGLWGRDKSISREQAAMILYGYAQHMGYNLSASKNLTGYADYGQMRSIARPAMSWAQASGIITNTSANRLAPQSSLNCGEANSILSRFVSTVSGTR